MRARQRPCHVLQPVRQDGDGIIDGGRRRQDEDGGPSEAFGAEPVPQQQRAERKPDAPAHADQEREEGDERQAEREQRIVIKRDREQHRRDDTDQDAHHAHGDERDDPFVGPQRADEELAQIARPQFLEKRHRNAELAPDEHVPQEHGAQEHAAGARDIGAVAHQEPARETPQDHLHHRPVDEVQGARPRGRQEIDIAQQHRCDPRRREAGHCAASLGRSRAICKNTSSSEPRP